MVFEQTALHDLQLEARGWETGRIEQRLDALRDQWVVELNRRNVDRQLYGIRPLAGDPERLEHNAERQVRDKPGRFGQIEEIGRLQQPARRMLPARQHFESANVARREVDNRLEIRDEFAPLDPFARVGFQLGARAEAGLHADVEHDRAIAAEPLGFVKGCVGMLEQRARLVEFGLRNAYPNRNADRG